MNTRKWLAAVLALGCVTSVAVGQGSSDPAQADQASATARADGQLKSAVSRVTAVTVYQGNALVTREVDIPEGRGLVELVVTPLPAQTVDSSLHAEGTDGLRVLSTRYRTRAVKEDTRKEVRAKETQIQSLKLEAERIQSEIKVIDQNLQLLTKLEGFTGATMQQLTEKGLLNSEATLTLTRYVMTTRGEKSTAMVALQQSLQANAAATEFANRELAELTAGSSRIERDAVVVVDNPGPAGKIRLNYLVTAATWRPQYRFRAGGEKDPIQLQYLAAIEQQSGEDWTGVDVTLSTAQPQLNATPPDLLALDITVVSRGMMGNAAPAQPQQQVAAAGMMGGGRPAGGGMGGMAHLDGQVFRDQSRELRQKAQSELIGNRVEAGKRFINDAAALEQAEELLVQKDTDKKDGEEPANAPAEVQTATTTREGPSVTYHLHARLTVPSRSDQQLIEVARIDTKPEYYYKAVPVLTSHVYRLADLVNKSELVLLPGEATMYVGSDFVGRMNLPLVAIGEKYTVGFGVDPQLQVSRLMVKKSRSHQGGNQVHNYDYRITIGSFKSEAVKVQLWDRLPRAEAEAVAVSLVEPAPKLSDDPDYKRNDRPQNLLRWDVTVEPGQVGEKAATVAYQFKLEYARDVAIASFKSKP
jgi:Domain of unknown function (DUF4139)/N-terminal domain of unknown function (DUF4140)